MDVMTIAILNSIPYLQKTHPSYYQRRLILHMAKFSRRLNVLRYLDASDGYPLQQRTKIVCFEVVFLFPSNYTGSRD